jgi:undecaprenyl-diphosphatase
LKQRLTETFRPWLWFVFFLLSFGAFSLAVNDGMFRSFDHAVGHGLRASLPPFLPWFFGVVCRTGNAEFTVPAGLLLVLFAFRRGAISRRQAFFWTGWFVCGMVCEHLLKIRLLQPHPGSDVANDPLDRYLKPVLSVETPGSYFSGHTFRAFWLALLVFKSCPACRVAALVWAFLVWIGVVVLGWHWTTDTLGALLVVGTGAAIFLASGRQRGSGSAEWTSSSTV